MYLKFLKHCALSLVLLLSLTGCQDFKSILGIDDPVLDFPPGEYIGKAKLIGETPITGANGQTANGNASVSTSQSLNTATAAQSPSTAASPAAAETNGATSAAGASQGQSLAASPEKSPEAEGVLKEVPKLIDPLEKMPGEKIKISFLPKKAGFTDGVGVIFLNDASQRFMWRTDGNNKDTWNVLFTKDNNVYSNFQSNFNFDGAIVSSLIENKLIGRLYINDDSKVSEYYIEAYQFFKPKIVPPKEAIAVKAGDDIVIDVEKSGEDPEELRAIMLGIPGPKQEASINELKVKNIEFDSKKSLYKVYIMTSKSLGKGDYSLYLIRSGSHKSNAIPIKI